MRDKLNVLNSHLSMSFLKFQLRGCLVRYITNWSLTEFKLGLDISIYMKQLFENNQN